MKRQKRLTKKQRKQSEQESRQHRVLSDAMGVSDLRKIKSEDGRVAFHTSKGMDADELKDFAQRVAGAQGGSPVMIRDLTAADFYLSVMKMIRNLAQRQPRNQQDHVYLQHIRDVWARMSQARIVDLGAKQFMDLYHEIDVWTTEQLIGEEWKEVGDPTGPMYDEGRFDPTRYRKILEEAGRDLPLDVEHLPFEHTFFMPGPGDMSFSRLQSAGRYGADHPVALAGFLVSHDGLVSEIGVAYEYDESMAGNGKIFYLVESVRRMANSNIWPTPATLVPWLVPALIAYVNEYRKFVVERPPNQDLRRKYRAAGLALKKKRPIPQPYYTVYLKSEKIIETWESMVKKSKPGTSFEYGHRFDVRGHERCYIRRGPLPLEEKDRKKLIARGYTVYTINPMTNEDMYRLTERGLPPKSRNEWLAIKTKWIDADIRPHRPGLPYIPAVRKPSKKERPELRRTG